jgi:hypothetical protein
MTLAGAARRSTIRFRALGIDMVFPRPRTVPPKGQELHPKEWAGLRNVSNHLVVELPMLNRLKELGLVEQKSGVWATTQQGQIRLLFGSAR